MKRSQVRDFETNNKDSKDFFKLINFAGLSGLLGGILIGCLLLSTLILFSYSFLVETGHAFIIVAYAIAYPAILLFFSFIIVELAIYFIGKLVLGKKQKLFQKISIFVPASPPGLVFFSTISMYLLFYIYDGLFNLQVIILITAAFLLSVSISFKLWPITKKSLEYLASHHLISISILAVLLATIIIFWMGIPPVPYPGYDLDMIKDLGNTHFKQSSKIEKPTKLTTPPNIILITIETLRADHIGAYGYERNVSPNIDKFAAQNIRFGKCYTQSPATVVNLTALFTSAYPGETGVYAQSHKLSDEFITLTEQLKTKGYSTIGIVTNGLLPKTKGVAVAQGFDYFKNFGYDDGLYGTSGPNITMDAISKLKESTKPYFLWLHYFEPHTPYNAPKEFFEKVNSMQKTKLADKEYPLIDYGSTAGVNLKRTFRYNYQLLNGNKKVKKGYIDNLYDAEILYVDSEVGKILTYLEENNQFIDSLIIITADHGESLGEHGLYCQHCLNLYRQSTEVPLIIHLPGNKRGKIVVDSAVSTIDIAPTILEVAGISEPANMRGTSLLQSLFGTDRQGNREFVLMTGWWDGLSLKLRKFKDRNPDFAIVSGEYKYIVHSMDSYMAFYPREIIHLWRNSLTGNLKADEMFNLIKDPLEKNNIKAYKPQIAKSLKRKLYTSKEFTSYINLRSEKLKTKTKEELTEEQIKKLKSLGYLCP
jgi:arylsulfatase A-like enzyme